MELGALPAGGENFSLLPGAPPTAAVPAWPCTHLEGLASLGGLAVLEIGGLCFSRGLGSC